MNTVFALSIRWRHLFTYERCCLGALCFIGFVVTRYTHVRFQVEWAAGGIRCSFYDYVIESVSGDGPISCSWFLCVLCACLLATLLARAERCPQGLLASGSWRRLCAGNLLDGLLAAFLVSAVEFLFIVFSGAVSVLTAPSAVGGGLCSFCSRESVYAAKVGSAACAAPPPAAFLVAAFAGLLAASMLGTVVFVLLRWLLGNNAAPLAILSVLGLTVVQSEYSFVYELFRSFGGSLGFVNPVYAVTSLVSIHWARWADGGPKGFAAMLALIVAVGCVAVVAAPYMRRARRTMG